MRESPTTAAETKLTRTEFAVVRAYAQGMSPVDIARRYLSDPDDEDHLCETEAVRKILRLRDRLIQFALQHGRADIAQMFEALRARSDVGMTRRVDALASLEGLGQTRPHPEHEVGLWFGPSLSRRLTAAGVRRIADLAALANARGSSWWRAAPGIGRKSAEIITRWLLDGGGMAGGQPALVRPYLRPPSTAGQIVAGMPLPLGPGMPMPVPLDRMLPPAEGGPIAEDLRRVRAWLGSKARRPATLLSYTREAERLLLWMARERLSLPALDDEALQRYAEFLRKPEPAEFWCGPAIPRRDRHWRPFEGPLSHSSVQAALRVVAALRRWCGRDVPAATPGSPVRPRSAAALAPEERQRLLQYMAWLERAAASSARHAVAWAAACMLCFERRSLTDLCGMAMADIMDGADTRRGIGQEPAKDLQTDTRRALLRHWDDRRTAGLPLTEGAAALAPLERPPTRRSQARPATSGYSPAGLEKLLRWSWRQFARQHAVEDVRFTPKRLRMLGPNCRTT